MQGGRQCRNALKQLKEKTVFPLALFPNRNMLSPLSFSGYNVSFLSSPSFWALSGSVQEGLAPDLPAAAQRAVRPLLSTSGLLYLFYLFSYSYLLVNVGSGASPGPGVGELHQCSCRRELGNQRRHLRAPFSTRPAACGSRLQKKVCF